MPGELDGEMADAAARAVDHDALPGLQPAVVEEALPGAQGGERQGRGLEVVERLRLRRERRGRNDGVLGGRAVAVERRQREDLVAGRDSVHVRADRLDHARELVRRRRRKPVDRPLELVAGERGGVDPDERLAWFRHGHVDLLEHEPVDPGRCDQTQCEQSLSLPAFRVTKQQSVTRSLSNGVTALLPKTCSKPAAVSRTECDKATDCH